MNRRHCKIIDGRVYSSAKIFRCCTVALLIPKKGSAKIFPRAGRKEYRPDVHKASSSARTWDQGIA
jgi:hypothetical protein